jgi:hypothetical protein
MAHGEPEGQGGRKGALRDAGPRVVRGAAAGAVRIEACGRRTRMTWPGLGCHWLTPAQTAVMVLLLEAAEARRPDMHEATLIRGSGMDVRRLGEVFVGSGVWGVLIVPGRCPKHYRAADVGSASPPG